MGCDQGLCCACTELVIDVPVLGIVGRLAEGYMGHRYCSVTWVSLVQQLEDTRYRIVLVVVQDRSCPIHDVGICFAILLFRQD